VHDALLALRPVLPNAYPVGRSRAVKVLIVDDSAIVRVRLAELLAELEGIDVVTQAEDALQAFELVKLLKPDVAILDVRMPRRSGIDLIADIKTTRQIPKIIVLTNYPTPEIREKCFSQGADYFFDKSGEIEEVISVLRELQRGCHRLDH
jgi:DNA-binding NarL/FixJ family response regulator